MNQVFGTRQKQSLFVFLFMLLGIGYYTYRNAAPSSPKAEVKKIIHDLVAGAESRDLGPFKTHFSKHITDESGRTRAELLNILRGIFLTNKKISLNLISLDIASNTNPNIIDSHLNMLMGESILPTDRGEFFLTFRKEKGDWRVTEIKWGEGYGLN